MGDSSKQVVLLVHRIPDGQGRQMEVDVYGNTSFTMMWVDPYAPLVCKDRSIVRAQGFRSSLNRTISFIAKRGDEIEVVDDPNDTKYKEIKERMIREFQVGGRK